MLTGIRLGLVPLLLLGTTTWAATGSSCGSIEFLAAKQFTLLAGSSVLAVVQKSDGSYTAYPHQPYSPYKQGTPIPNFQQQLAGCLPKAPKQSTGLVVKSLPAGAPGSGVLAIRDAGDGTPIGMWKQFYKDSIQVWQGNPDYTFRASANYAVGQAREAALSGDYNGDGKPDIAVLLQSYTYQANEPSGIKVLPGKGDGTFGEAIFTPLSTPNPRGFAQADFNGDGRLDLVVASNDTTAFVLYGSGDGKFVAGPSIKTGSYLTNAGAADVNGDGKADLQLLGNSPDRVYLCFGNGNGSFQAPVSVDLPASPSYVVAADMNADGIKDLVYSFRTSSIVGVALGKGDGTFAPVSSYLSSNQPSTLFPADVNQDGNLDIVVGEGLPNSFVPTEQNGYISVLFGRGDGTFISAPVTSLPRKLATFAMADLNGDGLADLASVDAYANPQTISVMLRKKGGEYEPTKTVTVLPVNSYQYFSAIAAGDFNGDGKVDLAFGEQSSGGVWISSGNGDGTFKIAIRTAVPNAVTALAAGDLNGDGRPDLAVAMKGTGYADPPSLGVMLNQASGAFGPVRTVTFGKALSQMQFADLNGDKKLDLVVGDTGEYNDPKNPTRIWTLKGNGDGTLQTAVESPVGTMGVTFTIGDATGDGLPDIVASTQGENYAFLVVLMANQGDGTFKNTPLRTDFGPGQAVITDLNGDKTPDLVIPHCCGDTDMTYMVGNGDGTFQKEVHFAGGQNPTAVFADDVNGDDRPDLLIMGGADTGSTGTLATLINLSPAGPDFKNLSGVSYVEMPLSPGSVAAAKGNDLATTFLQAPDSSTPQLSLNSTTVTITDAEGNTYPAPLFLIDPSLVLYLIPAEVPVGNATVSIQREDGQTRSAPLTIANVAPALSTVNGNGLVSGGVLRVNQDGEESWGDVATSDENGATVAAPIDLGDGSGHVYLIVNGTGFRNRSDLEHVEVVVSGHVLTPVSAGPMEGIPGMDQLRFELLPYLREIEGDIQLSIKVEGQTSNTATFRVH